MIPIAASLSAYTGPIPSTSTIGRWCGAGGASGVASAATAATTGGGAAVTGDGLTAATAAATTAGAATAAAGAGVSGAANAIAAAASGARLGAGSAASAKRDLTPRVLRYQMISPGMIPMARPIPVPGNWKNAMTASSNVNPAMKR